MTEHQPERRARKVALFGCILSLILALGLYLLYLGSGATSLYGATTLAAVATIVWFALLIIIHQKVRVRDEAFETEELRREQGSGAGAIFDVGDEQLLLAKNRLKWMDRWLLPVFTVGIVAKLTVRGLILWPWPLGAPLIEGPGDRFWPSIEHTGIVTAFTIAIALISFLFSRYAAGMARLPEWQILRSGASWLMGTALASGLAALAFGALMLFQTPVPERLLSYFLRILMVVLAGEVVLNFVLDFYRPRIEGEEARPAFDSRLLGLFSEPGGIARSIAEAINYQFGFEVSSTWFYKLLQRSLVPLLGFGVLTLLLITALVFIEADQVAVLTRFGKPDLKAPGEPVMLSPGLTVKLPWPIERVYPVEVEKIHELKIGDRDQLDPGTARKEELILWTNKHESDPHLMVLVGTPRLAAYIRQQPDEDGAASAPAGSTEGPATQPQRGVGKAGVAVPVSLLRVAVTLQYRITDPWKWLNNYTEPERVLRSLAEREVSRYCAGTEISKLMGAERGELEKLLLDALQNVARQRDLGIEIVFLGLQGIHPPEAAAKEFQEVVGAGQKAAAAIKAAESDRRKRLVQVAGDEDRAQELYDAITALGALESQRARLDRSDEDAAGKLAARIAKQQAEVDRLFFGDEKTKTGPIGGEAASLLIQARARRWELENGEHARATAFVQEMKTREAAPEVYDLRKLLEARVEATANIRKYIILGQNKVRQLYLNLQDPMSAALDMMLSGAKSNP